MIEEFLLYDLETSDLYHKELPADHPEQAWPVQFGAMFLDKNLEVTRKFAFLLKPPHRNAFITEGAFETHGIPIDLCWNKGVPQGALRTLLKPVFDGKVRLIGHNISFDVKFLFRYVKTIGEKAALIEAQKNAICTMRASTKHCALPPTESMKKFKGLKYKNPKLEELYEKLFGIKFVGAHDAMADVSATHKCLQELAKLGIIKL